MSRSASALPPACDPIGAHLEGIEVLGEDGRAMRIGELFAARVNPAVRDFLIAELGKTKSRNR